MEIPKDPSKNLPKNDPGDDVLQRFRYQSTYAAILSLYMFEEDSTIEEIYCELNEDILIKQKNGKFIGVQVKTRTINNGSFEINDIEIIKSIKRFINLEKDYVDKFDHFTISTNVGFSPIPSKSISHIIDLAKKDNTTELLKNRSNSKKWITQIAKQVGCEINQVIDVLKKIKLQGDISTIEDIKHKLASSIANILNLKDLNIGKLNEIAEKLIIQHINASSLANEKIHRDYFIFSENPKEEKQKDIIEGKKITKNSIEKIINYFKQSPILFFIKDSQGIPKSLGAKRLETKMDAGGISFENIQLTKDLKYSIENITSSWLYKYDEVEAENMFNQIKLIVSNICLEAFDETLLEDDLFGSEMLKIVRQKLKERYNTNKEQFFECSYEHLLGMAGILTEECKVWWSKKFQIN